MPALRDLGYVHIQCDVNNFPKCVQILGMAAKGSSPVSTPSAVLSSNLSCQLSLKQLLAVCH